MQQTELRNYGDGEHIVIYTTDNEVYQSLKKSAEKEVPYEIWKNCDPRNARKVAVDLYFPKKKKVAINKRILRIQSSTRAKSGKEKVNKV